jgi:YesN/AraC family two-component response regulator
MFSILQTCEYFLREFLKDNKSDTPAQKILDHIHAHIDEELNLETLCKIYGTNHTCLTKAFKDLTGKTVTSYIIDLRVELAKHSLAFSNLSLSEISQIFGFKRLQYMIRVFNKKVGITPQKYRNWMKNARPQKDKS